MTFASSLFALANMPFTIALGAALLFAVLQTAGLFGHDGDHGGDHSLDPHHELGDGHGHGVLEALGIGRVPLSALLPVMSTAFALTGLAMNTAYLSNTGTVPALTLLWTVPVSLLASAGAARLLAGTLGRVLAGEGQQATTRKELVGQTGVVISSRVDGTFGEVRIQDRTGHTVRVICTTREDDPIAEGREVVVVEYDDGSGRLTVAPLDGEERRGKTA